MVSGSLKSGSQPRVQISGRKRWTTQNFVNIASIDASLIFASMPILARLAAITFACCGDGVELNVYMVTAGPSYMPSA